MERELIGLCKADLLSLRAKLQQYIGQLYSDAHPANLNQYIQQALNEIWPEPYTEGVYYDDVIPDECNPFSVSPSVIDNLMPSSSSESTIKQEPEEMVEEPAATTFTEPFTSTTTNKSPTPKKSKTKLKLNSQICRPSSKSSAAVKKRRPIEASGCLIDPEISASQVESPAAGETDDSAPAPLPDAKDWFRGLSGGPQHFRTKSGRISRLRSSKQETEDILLKAPQHLPKDQWVKLGKRQRGAYFVDQRAGRISTLQSHS